MRRGVPLVLMLVGVATAPVLAAAPAPPAPPARNDERDACERARAQLGDQIPADATPEACQRALDFAEEERWQLWLDIAAANALSGDRDRAALMLHRFLAAADARPRPLGAQWVVARDRARRDLAEHDAKLLETRGRITITSVPEGAQVTLLGGGAAVLGKDPKTPLVAYFAPGSHTARLVFAAGDLAREVTFTVTAGAVSELQVDLRKEAVATKIGVEDKPAPAVLGQLPPTDAGVPPEPPDPDGDDVVYIEERAPEDAPADEGPPIKKGGASLGESLGTVSIAAGGAAVVIGTTFALVASGLDDEAKCSGAACEVDGVLRSRVRRDADVAWDRATGMFVVGGVLVAGGVVALLLIDDDQDDLPSAGLAPWIGPGGAGLGGYTTF